jgi:hypothetical protein
VPKIGDEDDAIPLGRTLTDALARIERGEAFEPR